MKDKIIGYTQGAFDMFHVGHLNILKRAKEMCDTLIVGVNTDELVEEYKGRKTIIPLDERMAIVEAIKSVDTVVSADTLDKEVMLGRVGFDRVFIGSDWKGSERWIETETAMKKHGVQVVYLSHTDGISSTIIRDKLIGDMNNDN